MKNNITNEIRDVALQYTLGTMVHIFLTGKAGTGKTTLLKEIINKTQKNTAIVAPTGVAAINAGGVTIHSFFQLPTTNFVPDDYTPYPEVYMDRRTLGASQRIRASNRKVIQELELLIIDEISMVRADLLDAVDFTLRRVRKSDAPFGGVQLLVIGDLFQLSPVVKQHEWSVLSNYYDSPYFYDSKAWINAQSVTIQLEKIYRQSDEVFINILNEIRNGIYNPESLNLLNQRTQEAQPENCITLTTHNNTANEINNRHLKALKGKQYNMECKVKGKFYESAYPADAIINIKVGARVMFVKNHATDLYYNGKIGTVVDVSGEELMVKCDEDTLPISVLPVEWKNINYKLNDQNKYEEEELGSFTQYPLRLAWAVTIHKSQGLTFDQVVLDLANTFASGQLYVALSRCRSMEGIYLLNPIKNQSIIVDKKVLNYYQNFIDNIKHLEAQYPHHKQLYEKYLLKKAFNLNSILDILEEWRMLVEESSIENKVAIVRQIRKMERNIDDLQEVAVKFHSQIDYIFENDIDRPALKDRCSKGITYFTDQLHTLILVPFDEHISSFGGRKVTKKYGQKLSELFKYLCASTNQLYDLTFEGELLLPNPKKSELLTSKNTHFDPKADKQKPKGETYLQTLELHNLGYDIVEIAEARGLSVGTIEVHIAKLVEDGKIDASKVLSEDIIAKAKECWSPEMNLTTFKESVPTELTWGEIRILSSHFKSLMPPS